MKNESRKGERQCWDSNPGIHFWICGFQDHCLKPHSTTLPVTRSKGRFPLLVKGSSSGRRLFFGSYFLGNEGLCLFVLE